MNDYLKTYSEQCHCFGIINDENWNCKIKMIYIMREEIVYTELHRVPHLIHIQF